MSGLKRKSYNITRYVLETVQCIILNKRIFMIGTAILFIGTYYQIAQKKQVLWIQDKLPISIADGFVFMDLNQAKEILILPVFLYFLMILGRQEDQLQFLVREKSRIQIWRKRMSKLVVISLLYTIWETICILASSFLLTDNLINWHEKDSIFRSQTGTILPGMEGNLQAVIGSFVLAEFLTCLFAGEVFFLFKWLTNRVIGAWMIVIGLCFAEDFSELHLFFSQVSIFYDQWLSITKFGRDFLYGACVLIGIFIMGYLMAGRKEFLYAK